MVTSKAHQIHTAAMYLLKVDVNTFTRTTWLSMDSNMDLCAPNAECVPSIDLIILSLWYQVTSRTVWELTIYHLPLELEICHLPLRLEINHLPLELDIFHLPLELDIYHRSCTSTTGAVHLPSTPRAGHLSSITCSWLLPFTTGAGHLPSITGARYLPSTTRSGHPLKPLKLDM